jgi:hypothetical protein
MTTSLLTPYDRGKARQSGATLWRKQLLPVGTISYKGRVINFTREYLAGLVKAFNDRAYDAVPLQFADEDNKHTEKPEHRRGTVRDLELTDDGLDIIVAAGADASAYLTEYPDLGISAKIVEDYERADGKFFPAAIKHVLGTLDPRLTGMRQWQAIDAANDDGEVIDLTGAEYAAPFDEGGILPAGATTAVNTAGTDEPVTDPAGHQPTGTPTTEEHHMAFTADQEARLAKLLDLPDDKFEKMLAVSGTDAEPEMELTDDELQALIDSLDADEVTPEADPAADEEPVTAGASLSAEAQAAIDLANSRAEETSIELARVTGALNRAAYEKERDHYAREYGIPPRIVDMARAVLEGEGHVVDLANGSSADAGQIVRKVLKEIGQTVRMLDLSGEMGSPLDFSAETEQAAQEQAAKDRSELVSAVRRMTGI